MKEYIYLDTDLVNSYLAQLDEGILTKMITGLSTTDTSQEDGGKEIKNTTKGGLKAIIANGEHKYSKTDIDKYSSVYSENNSELIETALSDYSLDVLLAKLLEKKLVKSNTEPWKDGDLIQMTDETHFFDFEQLKETAKEENLNYVLQKTEEQVLLEANIEKISNKKNKNKQESIKLQKLKNDLKEYEKQQKNSRQNFKHVENFGSYMSILFPQSILTKTSNVIALCDKSKIRVNIPTLSLYSLTKRKFKILGTIIAQHKQNIVPQNGEQLPVFDVAESATTMFMELMLTNFELLEIGDYFIRPIAIYYEKE